MKEILMRCWLLVTAGFSIAGTHSKIEAFSFEMRLFFGKFPEVDERGLLCAKGLMFWKLVVLEWTSSEF